MIPANNAVQSIVACSFPATTPAGNKFRIGTRWREYHGANNWDGLLDPLDEALRSELIRYGKFVQATYSSFDFDPTSSSYGSTRFPKHGLLALSGYPDTGYKVTRNLFASSSVELPRWAEMVPSWVSNKTSWIGYVAVCSDEQEIERLGRRDIVIALRGTATCLEWLENFHASLTHASHSETEGCAHCGFMETPPCFTNSTSANGCRAPQPWINQRITPCPRHGHDKDGVMVQRGFWSLYSSGGLAYRSLREEIRNEVSRLLDAYSGDKTPISITVTGHSLGAALAILTAHDVVTTFRCRAPHVAVISFGGPRVGNGCFRRQVEDLGIKVLRIVNTGDIVTKVPGFVEDDVEIDVDEKFLGFLSKAKWAYSDVGQVLRVSCWSANMAACHDLDVYLQLLQQLRAACAFTGKSGLRKQSRLLPFFSTVPLLMTSVFAILMLLSLSV